MTRRIAGTRPSRLPIHDIRDFVPSSLADGGARNLYSVDNDATQHSTLVVGNTQTFLAPNLGRVAKVTLVNTVAAVSALTVQVIVDGRDVYDDTLRPSIATGATSSSTVEVPSKRPYKRGDVVQTVVEVVDALQTGTLNVAIETEPYELVRRVEVVPTPARQRLTRATQRDRYLPQPDPRTVLLSTFSSFMEATSGVGAATQMTDAGGAVAGKTPVGTPGGSGGPTGPKPSPGGPKPPPFPPPRPAPR